MSAIIGISASIKYEDKEVFFLSVCRVLIRPDDGHLFLWALHK